MHQLIIQIECEQTGCAPHPTILLYRVKSTSHLIGLTLFNIVSTKEKQITFYIIINFLLRPAELTFLPLCSKSWWFFSSFTGRWAWLPRAPSASSPDPEPVTGGMPGGCRPEGWGGSWTGGPWAAWERCCAWSCCCCKSAETQKNKHRVGWRETPRGNFTPQIRLIRLYKSTHLLIPGWHTPCAGQSQVIKNALLNTPNT